MAKISRPKQILLDTIRNLLSQGQEHLRAGDRRLLSPSALRLIERGTQPAASTKVDTLEFIRDTLKEGIPPVIENPVVLNRLWELAQQALSEAEVLWDRGDGGLLPVGAADAAFTLRTQTEDYTISQLQSIVVDLGGRL